MCPVRCPCWRRCSCWATARAPCGPTTRCCCGFLIPTVLPLDQVNQFGTEQINQYHQGLLQGNTYSYSHLNQSINAVKLYYCQVLRRTDMNFGSIDRPAKKRKLPGVLSREEVRALLRAPDNLKHRCLLLLLYSGGLRIGEILNLKLNDIQSDRNLLLIRGGKGQKDRTTLLSGKLLESLRDYYRAYRPKVWLFEGQEGGQYTAESTRSVFRAAMAKAGIQRPATPHTLRH